MRVIDVDRLADVFDHDAAEIADVVTLLVETADHFAQRIDLALDSRDAQEGARLAHELKGASGNAGAESLSERCRGVELAFKARNWPMARYAIADMHASLQMLRFETAE